MAALVPAVIRGRFFGLRNSVLGVITIVITISGGAFLDWFTATFPQWPAPSPFQILFTLAIISGLLSVYFLAKQPNVHIASEATVKFTDILKQTYKNINFQKFLRFAMVWQFAVNFISPFFIVYMIKDLHLSYTLISIYTIIVSIADLAGMGFWGNISDQIGNKAIVFISTGAGALLPAFWLFTDNSELSIFFLIPLLHLAGGFIFAGYNLCSANFIFSIAPKQNNTIFFALWAAGHGLAAAFGAISGGWVAKHVHVVQSWLSFEVDSGFKILFAISTLFRLASVFFLRNVQEHKGMPVVKAILFLRRPRLWANTLSDHPILQIFMPYSAEENNKNVHRAYWPLWNAPHILPTWIKKSKPG